MGLSHFTGASASTLGGLQRRDLGKRLEFDLIGLTGWWVEVFLGSDSSLAGSDSSLALKPRTSRIWTLI